MKKIRMKRNLNDNNKNSYRAIVKLNKKWDKINFLTNACSKSFIEC